ncbi:MAG: hypothetical protein WAZ48_00880 [Lysobacteraceae bacterium]
MLIQPDRPDITRALIHLTGDRPGRSARDALVSIMSEGLIRGSGNSGYIKGKNRAACFTEMPLSAIRYFIQHRRLTNHPYQAFGIAVSKLSAWQRGARPVVYLPDDEAQWIPEEERWRHVQLDYGKVDFTHEREWRVKGDFSLDQIGFYVVVPNKEEENLVAATFSSKAKNHVLGFLHLDYLSDFL